MLASMDYREVAPPAGTEAIVKLAWSLRVPADGPAWVHHRATPDGCMEIIRRLSGRSRWGGEQPASFVAGVSTTPAELELGAGSAFVGLRIWPWAWRLISGGSPVALADRWAPLDEHAPGLELPDTAEAAVNALRHIVASADMCRMAEAIRSVRTPGELSRRVGLAPRALQRWFERHVGQPPGTYLRLVRFSDAFARLGELDGDLAGHAAEHGFSDQAHMAREFRTLAGQPASRARSRSSGPFLRGD